jgi:hypothetical protein
MDQQIITFKKMSFSKTETDGFFTHQLDKGIFLGSKKGRKFLIFTKELLVTYAYHWQFDENLSRNIPRAILANVFGDIHKTEDFMEFGRYKFRQVRLRKHHTFSGKIKKLFPLGLQHVHPNRFWRILEKSSTPGLFESAIRAAIYAEGDMDKTAERFANHFIADKKTPYFDILTVPRQDSIDLFRTKEDYVYFAEVDKSKDLQKCFEKSLELIPFPKLP